MSVYVTGAGVLAVAEDCGVCEVMRFWDFV